MTRAKTGNHQHMEFEQRLNQLASCSPWVLRITEYSDKPVPVLVTKERLLPDDDNGNGGGNSSVLRDRGLIYGQALRRCIPPIKTIISRVSDAGGVPLELQRFLTNGRISFRGNLPLSEEAGSKLSLIFKLRERILDMDRVELIAWRVERFTREEAVYWLSRITQYGAAPNRWARAGLRLMLGGQPGDEHIPKMLERLRK